MPFHSIILAAGQGTRMRSATPKVLHPVLGFPMVAHVVERALAAGSDRVFVVVGHGRDAVCAALREAFPDAPLTFCVQAEQRGTADAVLTAAEAFAPASAEAEVLILNGDLPNLPAALIDGARRLHAERGAALTLVSARDPEPNVYGRILRDAEGQACGIIEFRDADDAQRAIDEVNVGIYLARADFLRRGLADVGSDNAQGEFYLTDLVAGARAEGAAVAVLEAADIAPLHGVNTRAELARAEGWALARRIRYWQDEGVTFEEPQSVRVEHRVTIGADTVIEGGTSLRGGTHVGAGCHIERGARLEDTQVGDGTRVRAGTAASGARIGPGCAVGPWAHLRPGTVLDEGVRIGNFVETKNAHFAAGAKASHLSYVGDAEIGAGCNIGAGTITCNYDGFAKHRTVLEEGVFIGSDTQLVAPVRVGRGAFVGAGSTITEDVPADALVFTRAGKRVIEGWAQRKRAAVAADAEADAGSAEGAGAAGGAGSGSRDGKP